MVRLPMTILSILTKYNTSFLRIESLFFLENTVRVFLLLLKDDFSNINSDCVGNPPLNLRCVENKISLSHLS